MTHRTSPCAVRRVLAAAALLLSASVAHAADSAFSRAIVTQAINEVSILNASTMEERPAEVNVSFEAPDIIKTGRRSRCELTAQDGTTTRVGANTIFSFEPESRTVRLQQGNVILNTPSGKGGAKIVTASASASVLGTTLAVSATPTGGFKALCLEGRVQIVFPNGQIQNLSAGQMTFVLPAFVPADGPPPPAGEPADAPDAPPPPPAGLPPPPPADPVGLPGPVVNFDLGAAVSGSTLLNGFATPLPSMPTVQGAVQQQQQQIQSGQLAPTGALIVTATSPNQVTLIPSDIVEKTVSIVTTPSSPLAQALATDLVVEGVGLVPAVNLFRGNVLFSGFDIFGNTFSDDSTAHTPEPLKNPGGDSYRTAFPYVGIIARNLTLMGTPGTQQGVVTGILSFESFTGAQEVIIASSGILTTGRSDYLLTHLEGKRELYLLAKQVNFANADVDGYHTFRVQSTAMPLHFGFAVAQFLTKSRLRIYHPGGFLDFGADNGMNLSYCEFDAGTGVSVDSSRAPITLTECTLKAPFIHVGRNDTTSVTLTNGNLYGNQIIVNSGGALTLGHGYLGRESYQSGQSITVSTTGQITSGGTTFNATSVSINGASGVSLSAATLGTSGVGTTVSLGSAETITLNTGSFNSNTVNIGGMMTTANLVSLNGTGFTSGVMSINIAARTVDLQDITFPWNSVVNLKSQTGQATFGSGSRALGHINFIANVKYGPTAIGDASQLTAFQGANPGKLNLSALP